MNIEKYHCIYPKVEPIKEQFQTEVQDKYNQENYSLNKSTTRLFKSQVSVAVIKIHLKMFIFSYF